MSYRKRQKLSKKKVSQFSGFDSKCKKTFAGLASFNESATESHCL